MHGFLTPIERRHLGAGDEQFVQTFFDASTPSFFKEQGNLRDLTNKVDKVIEILLEANPYWKEVRNSPFAALKRERDSLSARYEAGTPEEKQALYRKISDVEKKLRDFRCDLVNRSPFEARKAVQWDCDKISEIKKRFAGAVQIEKQKFEESWTGRLFGWLIPYFWIWAPSSVKEIDVAEQSLYRWDFKQPLFHVFSYHKERFFLGRIYEGTEEMGRGCHPWLNAAWVQKHLKTDHLYNYPHLPNMQIKNRLFIPKEIL